MEAKIKVGGKKMENIKKRYAKRYCPYCGKETEHEIEGSNREGNEVGRCLVCGSSQFTKIQGFSADLM